MNKIVPTTDLDDDDAEKALLEEAVAKARADKREIPHEEMRAWLLEIAAGNFKAKRPKSRLL